MLSASQKLINNFSAILFFPFLMIQSCSSPFSGEVDSSISKSYYYEKGSGQIIYSPMGNYFSLGYDKMDADKETFQPVSEDFGKDKTHVYYKSLPQEQVDASSFEIEDGIIRDKNHVYEADYFDLKIIYGADPASFQYISNENNPRKWAKDDFNYFYYNTIVEVDYQSFRELKNGWVVDKNYIYKPVEIYEDETGELEFPEFRLEKGDLISDDVQDLTNIYTRMGNNIYSYHFQSGFNNFSFDEIKDITIVADQCIGVDGVLLVNGAEFAFDAVDVDSFENIGGDEPFEYSRDKNHVYYEGKVIHDADFATFQVIKWGYARDNKNVYFLETIVEGADPRTFRYDEKKSDFVDATNIYRAGKVFKQ